MVSHNVAVMDDSESIQIHKQSMEVYILYIMRHWVGEAGAGGPSIGSVHTIGIVVTTGLVK